MEKITDKVIALPSDANYFSLEFFPPKTEMGFSNLQARLDRMSKALRPLFVNVTWGAGGSTSQRSLELAEICQRQLGLTTCLHLTCTNMSQRLIDEALEESKALGIRNILALRGDAPREDEYRLEGEEEEEGGEKFVWAADLVRYIRRVYGNYFCIGVAGYPEGHSDESNPAHQDPKHDIPYLVEKVKAGGDFIMTQLFYDYEAYLGYEKLVREWDNGVLGNIPIIPGLMPIQNFQILQRITKLSHAKLPPEIRNRLEHIKGDDEEVKRVGVDILCEIVEKVKQVKSIGPRGFHFYTLNLEKSVAFILERTHLIPPSTPSDFEDVIDDSTDLPLSNGTSPLLKPRRPSSAHNHVITSSSPSSTLSAPSRATTLAISHGVGSLGREATWDDYPNGRFGDARSPAFGEIDGYGGPTLHVSPAAARAEWGFPTSRADISALFRRHVTGDLEALPWSEGGLSPETRVICTELCALIDRGWWSIASQPAVDGVSSTHPIFGWGPRDGFVFQKAFVEFFLPARDWLEVLRPRLLAADVAGEVSWYAAPCPSSSSSAATTGDGGGGKAVEAFDSSSTADAVNSVTWGSFPGKEIVTPTIIEEISFRAWVEEAFGIWEAWERCFAKGTPARDCLRREREGTWLVNVIGHGYREEGRLWEILRGA